jgi:hypothetical protein
MKLKILIAILFSFLFVLILLPHFTKPKILYKGFGWYGYLADDEINEDSIQLIKKIRRKYD